MRIIAGEHRGRKLLPPEGLITRPMTDRAKQSIFDILSPMIEGARVYDCFAGTGSAGLECLSRGAAAITFFEADRSALKRLKSNIEAIDNEKRCQIVGTDLFAWFSHHQVGDADRRIDLAFLDPPYRFVRERPAELRALSERLVAHHLAPNATVVFRHDAADVLELSSLKQFDLRAYGEMAVEFLTPLRDL